MRHSISLRLPTIALLVLGPVDSIEATEPAANSTPTLSKHQITATLPDEAAALV